MGKWTRQPGKRLCDGYPTHGGFTLLEVLVVVAIIALLVALLIPSLAAARARRGVCASNLHQVAGAWQVYLSASGGHFFQCMNAHLNYGGLQGHGDPQFGQDPNQPVPKPLNPHLKLKLLERLGGEVFCCPADTGGEVEKPTAFDYYGTSYAANCFLIGQNQITVSPADPCAPLLLQTGPELKDLNRSRVCGESRLLLAGDFGWLHSYSPMSPITVYWHSQRDTHNLAFLDGHVDFVRIRKGLHVTGKYTTIPFHQYQDLIAQQQLEVPS